MKYKMSRTSQETSLENLDNHLFLVVYTRLIFFKNAYFSRNEKFLICQEIDKQRFFMSGKSKTSKLIGVFLEKKCYFFFGESGERNLFLNPHI